MVHRETGRGGRGAERRRLTWNKVLLLRLAGRRGLAGVRIALCVDGVLDAGGRFAFPKAKAFEARVHRAHREGGERGGRGEKRREEAGRRLEKAKQKDSTPNGAAAAAGGPDLDEERLREVREDAGMVDVLWEMAGVRAGLGSEDSAMQRSAVQC